MEIKIQNSDLLRTVTITCNIFIDSTIQLTLHIPHFSRSNYTASSNILPFDMHSIHERD